MRFLGEEISGGKPIFQTSLRLLENCSSCLRYTAPPWRIGAEDSEDISARQRRDAMTFGEGILVVGHLDARCFTSFRQLKTGIIS